MIPLRVTAHLRGPIALPGGGLALDALLMAAVAMRDELPPIAATGEIADIPIPVERRAGIYLASFALPAVEARENHYINRRFPVAEAQALGSPKIGTLNVTTGPAKSYRLPLETLHLEHDRLEWFAVGERDEIASLLALVGYLGKKRSVGFGAVDRWEVEACEPWGDGFPVVDSAGKPLRTLPLDWPGLVQPEVAFRGLTPPYWRVERRVMCAVPEGM